MIVASWQMKQMINMTLNCLQTITFSPLMNLAIYNKSPYCQGAFN